MSVKTQKQRKHQRSVDIAQEPTQLADKPKRIIYAIVKNSKKCDHGDIIEFYDSKEIAESILNKLKIEEKKSCEYHYSLDELKVK